MLEMRPDCERCGADLPAERTGALICSFECTFCDECADMMGGICSNCGGELRRRPTRVGDALSHYPASPERHYKG